MSDMRARRSYLRTVLRIAIGVIFFFPIYYLAITALKPQDILFAMPPRLVFKPTLDTIYQVLVVERNARYFINSLIVATSATAGTVVLAAAGAFAFAFRQFKGSRLLLFACLIGRMFPPVTTLIPVFLMVRFLGLLDNPLGLILPYVSFQIPLVLLIMKKFFEQLPYELFESAMLDGCTPLGAFARIAVPLSTPGLVASAILCFTLCWNEFLFGFVLTSSAARTAPVALATFTEAEGKIQWGSIAALGLGTIAPVLIFVGALHKYLVAGLTSGGIKQ